MSSNKTVVQLRTELKKLGLSTSGLKQDLVKRLDDALEQTKDENKENSSPNPQNNKVEEMEPEKKEEKKEPEKKEAQKVVSLVVTDPDLRAFLQRCSDEGISLRSWKYALQKLEDDMKLNDLQNKVGKSIKDLFTGTWIEAIVNTLHYEEGSVTPGNDYRYDRTSLHTVFTVHIRPEVQVRFSADMFYTGENGMELNVYAKVNCNGKEKQMCVIEMSDGFSTRYMGGVEVESFFPWIKELTGHDLPPKTNEDTKSSRKDYPHDKRSGYESLFDNFLKAAIGKAFSSLDDLLQAPNTEDAIAWSRSVPL